MRIFRNKFVFLAVYSCFGSLIAGLIYTQVYCNSCVQSVETRDVCCEPGVRGPAGEKGDPGEPGKDGRDGEDGEEGEGGEDGQAGEDGQDCQDGEKGDPGKNGQDASSDSLCPVGFKGRSLFGEIFMRSSTSTDSSTTSCSGQRLSCSGFLSCDWEIVAVDYDEVGASGRVSCCPYIDFLPSFSSKPSVRILPLSSGPDLGGNVEFALRAIGLDSFYFCVEMPSAVGDRVAYFTVVGCAEV